MFGMLLGTLNQFQTTLTKKSEAVRVLHITIFFYNSDAESTNVLKDLRREELEKKVQEKLQKEEENTVEHQKKLLKEQKEKEIKLKEELRKKTDEKELELLVCIFFCNLILLQNAKWQHHKEQLAKYNKTEAKPRIFWRPNPTPGSVPETNEKKEQQEEKKELAVESQSNESEAPQ